jgi:hypothetical protein
MSAPFVSPPMALGSLGSRFRRADLVFHGLDHSGPSYEVRIFFDRPGATEATPMTAESGYVASFFMLGHGGCAGQPGHCEVPVSRRAYDRRPTHQLAPATRWVTVTDAVRRAMQGGGAEVTVTAVPVVTSGLPRPAADEEIMALERVALVAYD